MNMQQFTTSIKKEIWEYKKIFLWIPIILAALIISAPIISYLLNGGASQEWLYRFERLAEVSNREGFTGLVYGMVSFLFLPFLVISTIVQLYYFIACLFDERRDLSILFWRSLPVSDAMSVGVKLLVGALILPALFLLVATLTLVVFLIFIFIGSVILSVSYDIALWGIWANSDLISHVFSIWFNLLPYTLWLFPVYAWLMLVSMFSSKAPFLWATLPIVILLLVEGFVVNYFDFNGYFFANILIDYFSLIDSANGVISNNPQSFASIALSVIVKKVNVVALLIGAGFIYATYWLRTNRSHS